MLFVTRLLVAPAAIVGYSGMFVLPENESAEVIASQIRAHPHDFFQNFIQALFYPQPRELVFQIGDHAAGNLV